MWMVAVLGMLVPRLSGQGPPAREPHLGYVFPAGAQSGTTVEVLIGGQNLRDSSQVVVSGPGVSARVLKVYRLPRKLDKEQRQEIQRQIAARRAVLAGLPPPPVTPRPAGAPALVMPEHPLLDRLAHADAAEIDHLVAVYLRANRTQVNVQLSEMVTLEVTVSPTASPGMRELRLLTPGGLTNPLRFAVGTYTEVCEREPNDPRPGGPPPPQVAALPVVFNGQVLPGDVDRLRFHARRGQALVLEVQARAMIPYLADAVPGWFQPVVAVFNSHNKEVAYADCYRFQPDPVLMLQVPDDDDYTVEIRDSIFRGRDDFVYRIKVSEQPFISTCFPLGAAAGSQMTVHLTGWNLPRTEVALDTRPLGAALRELTVAGRGMTSNPVAYAVDDSPDVAEGEPNNDQAHARAVPWPCVVNGRINQPGDIDVFRLAAPGGAVVMVEVLARRLGSPLDSVVRVMDSAGKVLAWNDDWMAKDGQLQLGDGLLTHHADSRVCVQVPTNGQFFVSIEDAQHHGGEAYGYRLRIAPAKADFALRVSPSALNCAPGQAVPVTVYIDRRDGFNGPVTLGLAGLPPGWSLAGNLIPPSCTRLSLTIQAPPDATPGVVPFNLTGKAEVNGGVIIHTAEACDDTMQAFLWRHLVPAREFLAAVIPGKARPRVANRIGAGPVVVPSGGETVVRFQVPRQLAKLGVDVVAVIVPDGLTVRSEMKMTDEIVVHLTADAAKLKPGCADNLILGASLKPLPLATADKKPFRANRGAPIVIVLPAVALNIQ